MVRQKPTGSAADGRRVGRAAPLCAGATVLGLGVLTFGPVATASAAAGPPPIPQPVTDAVQAVTGLTGLPDPLPATQAAPVLIPKHVNTTAAQPKWQRPAAPAMTPHRATSVPRVVTRVVAMPVPHGVLHATTAPQVAAPQVVQPASALAPMPALPIRDDTPRILLVAIATVLLGGLASGHIKAAQHFLFAQ